MGIWTCACLIEDMKYVTLHVSLIWHLNIYLAPLNNGLAEYPWQNPCGQWARVQGSLTHISLFLGHFSSYSRLLICRDRIPHPQRENLQDTPLEDLTTGLMEVTTGTLLPFTIVGTTNNWHWPLLYTHYLPAPKERDGLCLSAPAYPSELTQFQLLLTLSCT